MPTVAREESEAKLRVIMSQWSNEDLRDVIMDSMDRELLIEHIIDNDLLVDDYEGMLAEPQYAAALAEFDAKRERDMFWKEMSRHPALFDIQETTGAKRDASQRGTQ